MKNKIAIVLPTRNRPKDLYLFAKSWENTTEGFSDVFIQTDKDDNTDYHFLKKYPFIHLIGESKPFLHIVNSLATLAVKLQYKYIGFMEDDCCFVDSWEKPFIQKLDELKEQKGYGIVWGNDNINKNSIVGLPFMTSNFVKNLGYMVHPSLHYLWGDYYWKEVGQALDCLYYFPDILIEHRHYSTGKRDKCEISNKVDLEGQKDYERYKFFKENYFNEDVKRLKECIM